ncbi:MAG: TOBE domain-containing protein [Gammaproteobacteria bacterium]|nr:TOBE domain-containing protein [Gammaproteobacteria bacterium]
MIETVVAAQSTRNTNSHNCISQGGTLSVPQLIARLGQRVRVRIRACDVALARQRPTDISVNNLLDGVIAEIRDEMRDETGATVNVRIHVGEVSILARITRLSVDRLQLKPGVPVVALVKAVTFDRRSLGVRHNH